jgi:inner membrane transporter RhtA
MERLQSSTSGGVRAAAPLGALCVVGSCLCVQLSAALSSRLFDALGATSVSGLRQLVAAVVMIVVVRPRIQGRGRAEWARLAAYGAAMAVMNASFYHAVDQLPLGVAATLVFLGPFAIAALSVRRWWESVLALVALLGVVLVSRPGGQVETAGVAVGLLAAAALAAYTLLAQRVGRDGPGFDSLALSVCFSAMYLLPFSLPTAPHVVPAQWGVLAVSGAVGVTGAYTLDFLAIRLTGARVASTLFALDPVMGALVGAAVLGQVLTGRVLFGIALIVASGATVAWSAGRPAYSIRIS